MNTRRRAACGVSRQQIIEALAAVLTAIICGLIGAGAALAWWAQP